MTDLETRLREGLDSAPAWRSPDDLLDDVRRGARRRRTRRATGLVAAAALVLAATGGGLAWHRREADTADRPRPFQPGMLQISVTASGQVFEVVADGGCTVSCSIVRTRLPEGGWRDLATFRSPGARAFPGPVWKIAMAPNGRDGWVWGQHVYSTHDGGVTWAQVRHFPAAHDGAAYNDEILVGGDEAWAQVDIKGSRVLVHTPVGSDRWTSASPPSTVGVTAINALPDGRIVLDVEHDRGDQEAQHLLVGDGTSWIHEVVHYYRVPPLFHGTLSPTSDLAATTGNMGAAGYGRREGYSAITVGMTRTTPSKPVGRVHELYVLGDRAAMVTPQGVHPVPLRLGADNHIADYALLGNRVVFLTWGGRLFASTDNGRHWTQMP
jgi:hypothetical protein